MAISLFRKPAEQSTARPALAALQAQLDVTRSIAKQIDHFNTRLSAAHNEVRAADELGARVLAAREAIDTQLADAKYSDAKPPDMSDVKRRLKELEDQFVTVNESARLSKLVIQKLQSDLASLSHRKASLKPETDRLLWDACIEAAVVLQPEYQAAADILRNTAHKVFAALTAADAIAKSRGYGAFHGGEMYGDLFVPLPLHPAYRNPNLTPEAAQAIRFADIDAINQEAEALIASLLNGEVAA
jgi:hypothetical protein